MLSKPQKDITVGQILNILEGPVVPVACVKDDKAKECARSEMCISRYVWIKIGKKIDDVVHSITIESLADGYRKEKKQGGYMYYI